ncbi:hypothetical protein [Kitasatospora purpeofusca]|uniref:Transposase n=1 Tax=Kitasatospora purpeofusca TaxID=67352 RepID=A0ABZ1TWP5_9ACTN|nr:hypothetical protein [Kitasatospora purpeofusca]
MHTTQALTRCAYAVRLRLALMVGGMSTDRQAQARSHGSIAEWSPTPAIALLPL